MADYPYFWDLFMHPIVKDYITTDLPVLEIVEKHYRKELFFERIFYEISKQTLYKVNDSVFSSIDEAIKEGHKDQNIFLLFITLAIGASCNKNQIEKANIYYSIGASIAQENIYPEIYGNFLQSIGRLKYSEKNHIECRRLMKASLEFLEKNKPRYRNLFFSYSSMLAVNGQLNELSVDEFLIFNTPDSEYHTFVNLEAKIINHILTGKFQEGIKLLEDFKIHFKGDKVFKLQGFSALLKIISSDFNETNYSDDSMKLLAEILKHLSNRNYQDAVKKAKLFLNCNSLLVNFAKLISETIFINLELNLGNLVRARQILDEKIANGNSHYLDDLFYARIFLLEKNFEKAYSYISRLIENTEKYQAFDRVLFELKFAGEIKSSDLFILMKKFRNLESSKLIKTAGIAPAINNQKKITQIIGESLVITQVKAMVKKYAALKEIILITGETGTGKELVAKALHDESRFSKEPFLAVNCGALTDTLLESELFGFEAGTFTGALKQKKGIFEIAGKGTVFLDEFGDISPKLQVSLLRVLESNEIRLIGGAETKNINCRIIIATNVDLKKAVAEKLFREDLYYRLSRFEIIMPSLRERIEDLPLIINYFLKNNAANTGDQIKISNELLKLFKEYYWPGNIRELKNVIDRLMILNPEKEFLEIGDLDLQQFQGKFPINKAIVEKAQTLPTKYDFTEESNGVLDHLIESGLNAEQRVLYLKSIFDKYKLLTRYQVMSLTKTKPITANKDLQKLIDEGYIVRKTPTNSRRSNYYEIVSS